MHTNAIDSMHSEVGTAEIPFKTRLLNGAFCRNMKRSFGSWNCWENFEIKEAKRCILTLFETMFCKLELRRKLNINKSLNGAFCRNLKRSKIRRRFTIIECSGPDVIFKRLFRVVYYIILWKWHTINNGTQESGTIVYSLK